MAGRGQLRGDIPPPGAPLQRERDVGSRASCSSSVTRSARNLFPKTTGNRHATRPWETGNYNRVLREFSLALGLRDADGQLLLYSRSHQLRHTKATYQFERRRPGPRGAALPEPSLT